ncbi:hypothetical protein UlMin_028941 [Ulmus minor]
MFKEKKEWEVEPQLQKYVLGDLPRLSNPWVEVDHVYFLVNVGNYHWFLGLIDLPNWNLMNFDSLRGKEHDDKVTTLVVPISRMLPWVLESVGYFDIKKNMVEKKGKIFHMCWLQSPHQLGFGDCGIFTCKFGEFMMHKKSHQLVEPYKIKYYREKYVVELYYHVDIKRTRKMLGHDKHC